MPLVSDLRTAVRRLARAPGFAATAVVTLGLGIGAATAIFTVVDGVLLRPLPFPSPERLVDLAELAEDGRAMRVPEANFLSWQEGSRGFAGMALYATSAATVTGAGEAVRAATAAVSGSFFEVLGVAPVLGRGFSREERQRGSAPVVVASDRFWRRVLGAESDLAKLALVVDGQPVAVVGVAPAAIDFPAGADLWRPLEALGPVNPSRSAHNWRVVARLAEGTTVETASAEIAAVSRRLHAEEADVTAVSAVARPLREAMTGSVRRPLLLLAAAVTILLAVAAFNVVSLVLARVAAQGRDGAVRAALGASAWQLAAPFLAECLVLALAGGLLGAVVAGGGVDALLALDPGRLPRASELGVDLGVFATALALSLLVAVGVGLVPGLRAGRVDSQSELREGGRGQVGARSTQRLRSLVVAVQVGLTLVLLVGASLLGRSFLRLLEVDLGIETADRLVVTISSPPVDEGSTVAHVELLRRAQERLGALPGVISAGGVDAVPTLGGANGRFLIEGRGDSGDFWPAYHVASTGYFETLGIPLLAGRLFAPGDDAATAQVAVISETTARRAFPAGDALGARVNTFNMDGDERFMTIVGVVGDVREDGPAAAPAGSLYVHALERPSRTSRFMLVLRTAGDPLALAPAVRAALRELAPDRPLRLQALDDLCRDGLADRRFALALIAVFGGSALLLALLGVYGAVAYTVAQRVPEVGLRMALGARPDDVVWLFVRDGGRFVLLGAAGGLVAALGASRLLSSLLFEVTASDPPTYAAALATTVGAGLLACFVPARRGAAVDPVAALRRG